MGPAKRKRNSTETEGENIAACGSKYKSRKNESKVQVDLSRWPEEFKEVLISKCPLFNKPLIDGF